MKKGQPRTVYLKDYQVPAFLIDQVELCFELGESSTRVTAVTHMRRNPNSSEQNAALGLDGESLKLESLHIDGEPLAEREYALDDEGLSIEEVPDRFVLEVITTIEPQNNTSLEGLYQSSGNFCTQCEAQGFRKITYFLDRPDVMATYTVRIEAEQKRYPVLLSNGDNIEKGTLGDGRHYAVWRDPFPKPSYLFALVAGNLVCQEDCFKTQGGREISLQIFTQAHNSDKCDHAMASLKKAMRWDEETFGLEYDLDTYMIVAVDDFNMGAMENKGLNIFNSKYVLASPETATDQDYMGIEAVIAHEYFHNWTGNRVTCRDWFQLSLKEGLTVFRDQEFTSDMTSRAVKRIQDVRMLRAHQFVEDASPMAHPVRPSSYIEINNFYTLTVYEKGAEIVRMYQTLFGVEGFKKGLQLYLQRHDGQAVTTDDFAQAMADANDTDLTHFLRWYEQSGTPELEVTGEWESDKQRYLLSIKQSGSTSLNASDNEPLYIPLRYALLNEKGEALQAELLDDCAGRGSNNDVLLLSEAEQTFIFERCSEQPIPSLLRDFSAPVKLSFPYSQRELALLMASDQDSFNRWEAGQKLAIDCLLKDVEKIQSKQVLAAHGDLARALRAVLEDVSIDHAFRAEMLCLPDESYLAEMMSPIDVNAIYEARMNLRKQIATELREPLQQLYAETNAVMDYTYTAEEMGRRRICAIALAYLCSLQEERFYELAHQHYTQANNMTDQMAALDAINDFPALQRESMLADFEARWEDQALVMDKWFALHARSRLPDALGRVKALLEHGRFSFSNPNRVRSVIGVFSNINHTGFHREDGSGYEFLAEQVLSLDANNPQLAARMVKPLVGWKKYDPVRQEHMRSALTRLKQHSKLSKDVFELVSKSLADEG